MTNNKEDARSPTRFFTSTLADMLMPLQQISIPVQNWTTEVISSTPIPIFDFIETVSVLSPYKEKETLLKVIDLGCRKGHLRFTYKDVTPIQLYKFCKWLNTAEGRQELAQLPMPEDISAMEVLQQQLQAMKVRLKFVSNDYDARIEVLKLQIVKEEAKKAEALELVRAEYAPACDFTEMKEDELIQICKEKYEARQKRLGEFWKFYDVSIAKTEHQEDVKLQHAMPFVRKRIVREALCNYLKRKHEREHETENEKACTCSKHLKLLGGEVAERKKPKRNFN